VYDREIWWWYVLRNPSILGHDMCYSQLFAVYLVCLACPTATVENSSFSFVQNPMYIDHITRENWLNNNIINNLDSAMLCATSDNMEWCIDVKNKNWYVIFYRLYESWNKSMGMGEKSVVI
jgi:hypothetical protein